MEKGEDPQISEEAEQKNRDDDRMKIYCTEMDGCPPFLLPAAGANGTLWVNPPGVGSTFDFHQCTKSYGIDRLLGYGNQGNVYEVTEASDSSDVKAVKMYTFKDTWEREVAMNKELKDRIGEKSLVYRNVITLEDSGLARWHTERSNSAVGVPRPKKSDDGVPQRSKSDCEFHKQKIREEEEAQKQEKSEEEEVQKRKTSAKDFQKRKKTKDRTVYLSMMQVQGPSLANVLQQAGEKRLVTEQVREIARQLFEALDFMHRKAEVAHGDLKPDNILLSFNTKIVSVGHQEFRLVENPLIKICDFGLATSNCTTQPVMGMHGAQAYMSPENLCCQNILLHPADVWAAGIIVWQLINKRAPFQFNVFEDLHLGLANMLVATEADLPVDMGSFNAFIQEYDYKDERYWYHWIRDQREDIVEILRSNELDAQPRDDFFAIAQIEQQDAYKRFLQEALRFESGRRASARDLLREDFVRSVDVSQIPVDLSDAEDIVKTPFDHKTDRNYSTLHTIDRSIFNDYPSPKTHPQGYQLVKEINSKVFKFWNDETVNHSSETRTKWKEHSYLVKDGTEKDTNISPFNLLEDVMLVELVLNQFVPFSNTYRSSDEPKQMGVKFCYLRDAFLKVVGSRNKYLCIEKLGFFLQFYLNGFAWGCDQNSTMDVEPLSKKELHSSDIQSLDKRALNHLVISRKSSKTPVSCDANVERLVKVVDAALEIYCSKIVARPRKPTLKRRLEQIGTPKKGKRC